MATRAQRNQRNRDKDAAAPAIASNVFSILVTAVTEAIMTAITNKMVPVSVMTKTITYSYAIGPYKNDSFEMKTKEGK